MRISPLRGVGATANTFASESFIDEIAHSKGVDPIEWRLELLKASSAAQFEGAIVFALSNILKEKITIKGGVVQQSNFHDYPILRMHQMPKIQTRVIRSTRKPTGVGDTVGVSVAPAVANAYRALTGHRLTALPFRTERLPA